MKRELPVLLRSIGLLGPADRVHFSIRRAVLSRRNRRFACTHPDIAMPPPDLAFDAYGHVDCAEYWRSGLSHAAIFADIIRGNSPRNSPGASLAILEWGCGPGRIIRHMARMLPGLDVSLSGVDVNERSIEWCRAHVPGVDFATTEPKPPLPFASGSFDVVYNFSVFSHLSEAAQKAWAAEILRVLKLGGRFICTTNGDYYCHRLGRAKEAARYRRGEVVVRSGYGEGKKWFPSFHPHRYVREELLRGFVDLRLVELGSEARLHDDQWLALRPSGDSAMHATVPPSGVGDMACVTTGRETCGR